MPNLSRKMRRSWVALGLGVALAIAAVVVPPERLAAGRVGADIAATQVPSQGGECVGDKPSADVAAEVGSAVAVDGIQVVLEELEDTSVGSKTVTAAVGGKDGEPLTAAMVYVTIRMPTMDHGVSAYPATEVAAGRYRAEDVSLGMGGEWVVTVEVVRQARPPISAAYLVRIDG